MAVKKRKPVKKRKKRKEKRNGTPFYKDERFAYIVGGMVLIIASYLAIAFVSFLFHGAADQSKLDLSWTQLVFNSNIKVDNQAGKTGAFLAEVMINRGFGIASFIFIYLLVITGLRILGWKQVSYRKAWVLSIISVIWLSVALGYIFMKDDAIVYTYPGGRYGFVVSMWLNSLIGRTGTALLLLLTAFITLTASFESVLPWLKQLFRKKQKPETVTAETGGNESGSTEDFGFEETILKVIDEDDVVKAIFDPDTEGSEPGVTPDDKEIVLDIQTVPAADKTPEQPKEPELTVEEGVDEEVGDFSHGQLEDYDPTLELSNYKMPSIDLLIDHHTGNAEVSNEELISNKNKIVETLRHYKIEIIKIRATIGPAITLYEIVPAPGIRIAKIKNLEDDIALSLAALGIRIIAPIPGRGTIGIEVPNQQPEIVSMRSIISSKKFQESTAELPVVIGKTISNETYMFDLVKMPHILVAGATGQGKSVGLNVIITSLLYKKHPAQLKFIFIDPKKVELSLYSSIENHFLAKLPGEDDSIITDIQKVKNTLNSVNIEMDYRYDLLKKAHSRNIKEYNKKFIARRLNPEKGHRYLPYIVVVIDEFADLIMTAGKEIELPIARIAQLARAVGIHMIIATQRPSTNIITGVIKANFPTRIAFKVASMIDSRTILDTPGANQLIGKGDMLIAMGSSMTRVQCAFIDTPEAEEVCKFIAGQQGYPEPLLLPEYVGDEDGPAATDLSNIDELFEESARLVVLNQMGSTSMIQRKLAIGYNRAGRIMDQLEATGVVGPSEGSKARQVLIQDEYSLEQLLNSLD
ncbi:DNA translocase FtsK [hydrothermal vent metagenome]|uniref:DNA translocase FtsK n=1 Tax=hydrothermal vent metagenome TaxID=652676 RepID=A0A3B0TYF4_9ZZZZ